jgi:hypothetical protein
MSLLKWNQKRVQNLTPLEIWMFIAGRVLVGFGLGALVIQAFPNLSYWLTFPPLILGAVLLIFAARGLLR